MIWIFIDVCITVIMLVIRLFRIKRQLRNVTTQLDERTGGNTEKKVTVSLMTAI